MLFELFMNRQHASYKDTNILHGGNMFKQSRPRAEGLGSRCLGHIPLGFFRFRFPLIKGSPEVQSCSDSAGDL